jgi:hypothetical protein
MLRGGVKVETNFSVIQIYTKTMTWSVCGQNNPHMAHNQCMLRYCYTLLLPAFLLNLFFSLYLSFP